MSSWSTRQRHGLGPQRSAPTNTNHYRAHVNLGPKKAHRGRCGALAAVQPRAAQAQPLCILLRRLARYAAGLARVTRPVQSDAAVRAAARAQLGGQILIDLPQYRVQSAVGQQGCFHGTPLSW